MGATSPEVDLASSTGALPLSVCRAAGAAKGDSVGGSAVIDEPVLEASEEIDEMIRELIVDLAVADVEQEVDDVVSVDGCVAAGVKACDCAGYDVSTRRLAISRGELFLKVSHEVAWRFGIEQVFFFSYIDKNRSTKRSELSACSLHRPIMLRVDVVTSSGPSELARD